MQMIHEPHRSEVNDGGNDFVTINHFRGYINLGRLARTIVDGERHFAQLPRNWYFVEVKSCE